MKGDLSEKTSKGSVLIIISYKALLVSGKRTVTGAIAFAKLKLVVIVFLGGTTLVVDADFIHLDAQGSLVFLFLPIYQCLLTSIFEFVGYIYKRRIPNERVFNSFATLTEMRLPMMRS